MRAEEAQARLKSHTIDWKKAFEERLKAVSDPVAALARDVQQWTMGGYIHTQEEIQKRALQRQKLIESLEGLPAPERIQVFGVLFPRFPELIEQVWQAMNTHPYEEGYDRRAFRAPNHPLTREKALNWLLNLWQVTRDHDEPLEWFAAWAARLENYHKDELGHLFAEAINAGHQEVLSILKESASGEHEIGTMGRHITRAFLTCNNPECWTYMEKMLLAAQRQEGLRQVILETIDEAHPEAFQRMVALILQEDLLRFSAVVRAIDVWFGWMYEASDKKTLTRHLQTFLGFLNDTDAARQAIQQGSAEEAFLALWALGFYDAPATVQEAASLLQNKDAAKRYAAASFLKASKLPEAAPHDLTLLQDPDLRVATLALPNRWSIQQGEDASGLFDVLEEMASRASDRSTTDPILWPWTVTVASRAQVVALLPHTLGNRPLTRLIPHIPDMEPYSRSQVAELLGKHQQASPELRELLFKLLADSSSQVRESAFVQIKKLDLNPSEAQHIEGLLTRKSADLRRGSLQLLLAQPREAVLESARRLTGTGKTEQRQAGLELLLQLQKRKMPADQLQEALEGFAPKNANEQQLLGQLEAPEEQLSLKNGLGLFDPSQLAPVPDLKFTERNYADPRVLKLFTALDHLVHQHRETPVTYQWGTETHHELLGNINGWQFNHVATRTPELFPLRDLWLNWWNHRPESTPEDLVRMFLLQNCAGTENWFFRRSGAPNPLLGKVNMPALQYDTQVNAILMLLRSHTEAGPALDFLLDAMESHLSTMDPNMQQPVQVDHYQPDPREILTVYANQMTAFPAEKWTLAQRQRLFKLYTFMDRGFTKLSRMRAPLELLLQAFLDGQASEHDVLDQLIGEHGVSGRYSYRSSFDALQQLSGRKPNPRLPHHDSIQQLVQRVRERILTIETSRADLSTITSEAARAIRHLEGAEHTLKMLSGMGKDPLVRGYSYSNESRSAVFSHLIRVSFPAVTDTPENFKKLVKSFKVPEARLLDLAMYAPQWSALVAQTLGWEGLADAIYWLHAHTRDQQWFVDRDIKEVWEAEISERTPLTPQDLVDGAVDVQWFRTMHATLGEERFAALYKAAKYASSAGGHKRAELFARSIQGEVQEQDLQKQIEEKRHQDSVRAIGLLPTLQEGSVLNRYRTIQNFLSQSKQFGAQRQASEQLAGRIGLQNLARTAGYLDPERLMWAMETEEVQALNGKTLLLDEVQVTLQVNLNGDPELHILKAGKALKSLPAALKKHPEYKDLQDAKARLVKQKSRMKEAFEFAMVRGDHFALSELQSLLNHPVLKPMLQNLLWVRGEQDLGFFSDGQFQQLETPSPLTDEGYRIAHPHDLLVSGQWRAWQKHCFEHSIQQPFKQIFREHYLLTQQELGAMRSTRYEGHQVNPKQALALLKTRNWISVPEEGVRKTFHAEGINVWLEFEEGYSTPMEVEGLTVSSVVFTERGKYEPLPLEAVPPRLFSETMRDLDLVVSVAHMGGVDPEASQSTVEMRQSLLRETLRLLKQDNVRLEGHHALISGHYGDYSVHLGSGVVHRQPGGYVCIVPVHAQHQGRVFLPFADNDPRTAEVVSKVLLLARDRQIQDPTILEQLV